MEQPNQPTTPPTEPEAPPAPPAEQAPPPPAVEEPSINNRLSSLEQKMDQLLKEFQQPEVGELLTTPASKAPDQQPEETVASVEQAAVDGLGNNGQAGEATPEAVTPKSRQRKPLLGKRSSNRG